jgi:hypothetical protein
VAATGFASNATESHNNSGTLGLQSEVICPALTASKEGRVIVSVEDSSWRSPKRVALNIAVLYAGTYYPGDDRGNIAKARETLDKYNIELRVWPEGGKKGSGNVLADINKPIPHDKAAYQAVRLRVNQQIRNCGFSVVMPALFCQFDHPGYGITPPSFKLVTPGCMIGPTGNKDLMDLVHEIGHAADNDHVTGDENRANFMHEADGRSVIFRSQVEKLAKATFSVA